MSGYEEQALLELNLRRETWCQVESSPRQSWERTERKHYQCHLRSSPALRSALTAGQQPRAARTEWPLPVKLTERRHFEDNHKTHLV
ncbi:spermatogenesis-associated protein 45 [Genypterus blacodes]|uniref:spermatogenesis-associated protein 45 n=1 Tax=Genypterus blacodes TaxID=154954 RepID=UPI003F760D0E